MWTRAVWQEDGHELEGVIPSAWVEGKNIRWPTGINVIRALENKELPSTQWHTFPLVKVKCTSVDKETCNEYEFTTTDVSDDELPQDSSKKPITSKKCSQKEQHPVEAPNGSDSDESPDGEDQDTVNDNLNFPTPPKKINQRTAGTSSAAKRNEKRRSSSPQRCGSGQKKARGPSPARPPPRPTVNASKNGHGFPMPEARFQQRVLHLLMEIKNTLAQVGKRCEADDSEFHVEQATDLDQFKALETSLDDEEKENLLLSRLSKIGGLTVKENVRNVMHRLMNNIVMASMNFKGSGGKFAFGATKVFKIVTKSVLKHQNTTETDITRAIMALLKYAPDRTGGGGRPKDE